MRDSKSLPSSTIYPACPNAYSNPAFPPEAPRFQVPSGPDWIHEIKHDGYRLIVQRQDKRVRLFTRNGHDWTDRYPLIVEAALRNRATSFVIDGEAVLLGVDDVSDFDGLHTGKHDVEVQLYAFDCLALDGGDLRKLPLSLRKTNLARLLARRPDGIFLAPFEQGEIGPDLFRKAGAAKLAAQRAARIYHSTVKVMDALRGLSRFDCNLVCHEARERLAVEKPRSNRSPQASQVTAGEKTNARPL